MWSTKEWASKKYPTGMEWMLNRKKRSPIFLPIPWFFIRLFRLWFICICSAFVSQTNRMMSSVARKFSLWIFACAYGNLSGYKYYHIVLFHCWYYRFFHSLSLSSFVSVGTHFCVIWFIVFEISNGSSFLL